jgi:glycosyltransferase involved in cell wall biosynthesis
MKVLQVLTLVGPGNPFGGPASVASNQATELRRRGHDVVVAAAQPGPTTRGSWRSNDVLAFDARQVIRHAGFSGIVSVGLCRYLWQHVREYDIVHVHMSRDLITMPAAIVARLRKVPYVVQTHGMIDASTRRSARVLDAIATRRILSRAARVFVLTPTEMTDVNSLMNGRPVVTELLPNGIRADDSPSIAQVDDSVPEVLYCSRLHRRKRPASFARAAIELLHENIKATFAIVGSDEGELSAVQDLFVRAGRPPGMVIEAPLEPNAVHARLARCAFVVLPSVDEPFPMIVLEALAAGRAVVITESCGLADFVRSNSCGVVVPPDDQAGLEAAMRDMVLDPDSTQKMGERGLVAIKEQMSIETVVDQLLGAYKQIA